MDKDSNSWKQVEEGSGKNDPGETPRVAKPKGDPLSRAAAPKEQSEEEEKREVTEGIRKRETGS